jgi:phosphatidylinositol glycan class B
MLGALLAVATAAVLRGRVHQDEIFQFLEPANHLAFGPWERAWEWEQGLRNWAVPGVLGGFLKLFALVGVRHPWALAAAVWVLCAAAQALGTLALYRLVEERDGSSPALLAALVHATWGGWLLYAARPLGDALSVAALLPALLFAQRRRGFHSGLFLGVAFVIRYPSAVFALPIAASLLRNRRELLAFIAGGLAVLFALALLDSVTWGSPLASVFRYLDFNLNHSQQFGERPWWWYAPMLASMAPLLLSWHFLLGLRRADLVVGAFATYLGALILVAHKEPRFLVPLLPLFTAIAAAPAFLDLARLGRGAVIAAAAYAASSLAAATVQRPFGVHANVIDATVEMGRDAALTSALIAGLPVWNTGGRFYFGRGEPLYMGAEHLDAVSHALVVGGALPDDQLARAGLTRWRSHGEAVVWRRQP